MLCYYSVPYKCKHTIQSSLLTSVSAKTYRPAVTLESYIIYFNIRADIFTNKISLDVRVIIILIVSVH